MSTILQTIMPDFFVTYDKEKIIIERKHKNHLWVKMTIHTDENNNRVEFETLPEDHRPKGQLVQSVIEDDIDQSLGYFLKNCMVCVQTYVNDMALPIFDIKETLNKSFSSQEKNDRASLAG